LNNRLSKWKLVQLHKHLPAKIKEKMNIMGDREERKREREVSLQTVLINIVERFGSLKSIE
jgi:hypothetical protein